MIHRGHFGGVDQPTPNRLAFQHDSLITTREPCEIRSPQNRGTLSSAVQARVVISDWKHEYTAIGIRQWATWRRPARLPRAPAYEQLLFAVDQFAGSGHMSTFPLDSGRTCCQKFAE